MQSSAALCVAIACLAGCLAQPFQPGQGVLPLGNWRTSDRDGPYNLTLMPVQAREIEAGIAAKQDYTDADIIDFLVNVECLEGLFDTCGTQGRGFLGDLELGGPKPVGCRKAPLSDDVLPWLEEVALNEQGHALFTRHAGSSLPCPAIDFDEGFNKFFAYAYGVRIGWGQTAVDAIKAKFGAPFDPMLNDATFTLAVTTLEEFGATGNKGLIALLSNPVLANGVAGLATSATAQAAIERSLLWRMRNATVEPFGETVQQVFSRVSVARDELDGPQVDDQGLTQTDSRNIAVADQYINAIPTDIRGLTFCRTPQMLINMATVGGSTKGGKTVGGFFPEGLGGKIVSSKGYDVMGNGAADYPKKAKLTYQGAAKEAGEVPPPITPKGPQNVSGEWNLIQALNGPKDQQVKETRGYENGPPGIANDNDDVGVDVALSGRSATPSKAEL
eukprot:jgi/Astpho2/9604/Aster-03876